VQLHHYAAIRSLTRDALASRTLRSRLLRPRITLRRSLRVSLKEFRRIVRRIPRGQLSDENLIRLTRLVYRKPVATPTSRSVLRLSRVVQKLVEDQIKTPLAVNVAIDALPCWTKNSFELGQSEFLRRFVVEVFFSVKDLLS